MAFSDKADQIDWIASLNWGTDCGFGYSLWHDFSIVPNLIILVDWGRMNWGPLIIGDDLVTAIWLGESKLEVAKVINNPRNINAVFLNIKINRLTLVNMCVYQLATNWQNVTEISIASGRHCKHGGKGYFFRLTLYRIPWSCWRNPWRNGS